MREVLAACSGVMVDDAVLVADELVTNALRHGQAPRICRLTLLHHPRRLRIEVDDTSTREPRIRAPDHTGGRGLILVDRLSSRWGTEHHNAHKTVWAELDLDTPGSSGHAPHLTGTRTWADNHPNHSATGGTSSAMNERPATGPAPTELDIVHHDVDGILVITVTGEIDSETAPALHTAVTAGIDRSRGKPCILDLTEVTFLGSTGLSALVDATRHANARREPLRIVVDANRPVIRPIEVTGLDDVLKLYHSVDEAVNAGTPW